jgi:hypothetical protein
MKRHLKEEIVNTLRDIVLNEEFPATQAPAQQVSMKPKMVRFNKGLDNEFTAVFSQRGFSIGDTRMSFEEIGMALSKEYTIVLKDGTTLDAVKMQQIMKYEDLF